MKDRVNLKLCETLRFTLLTLRLNFGCEAIVH